MDLKQIKKFAELMDAHDLNHFHFEKKDDDFKIELKKKSNETAPAVVYQPQAVAPPAATENTTVAPSAANEVTETTEVVGEAITSPMVGTFYRKPAPDAPNFCEVGDTVQEGDTICIIEAMKVMNEVKASASGVVASIIAEDGSPVQFGDTLIVLK